jgi:ParB family chromosome partitioning protein
VSDKKSALGKGLDALLSLDQDFDLNNSKPSGTQESRVNGSGDGVLLIPLDQLEPNPEQPRTFFSEESLLELSDSIRQRGIIQPILVEKNKTGNGYLIVAGERRYRAAKMADLDRVPAIVRLFSHEEKLEIALIENIQRENLSPLEEAKAYRNIMEELHITQQDVADRVGKNRSTVANSLRLLKLPEDIQQAINNNTLSAGHARAVLSLNNPADQASLSRIIMEKGLSVRDAETMAGDWNSGKGVFKESKDTRSAIRKDPDITHLEEMLIEKLGTRVQIKGSVRKGKIEITFYSADDLQRVLDIVSKP